MCVTPLQQMGGCAFGRVCKREGQALAQRSDLRVMPAQPSSPAIMPSCVCVCAYVCACVCMCVCVCVCVCASSRTPTNCLSAIGPMYCPTMHQVGVRQQKLRARTHAHSPWSAAGAWQLHTWHWKPPYGSPLHCYCAHAHATCLATHLAWRLHASRAANCSLMRCCSPMA